MKNMPIKNRIMVRSVLVAVSTAVIGLILSYLIANEAYEGEKKTAQARFEADSQQIVNRIETRLEHALDNANQIIALRKSFKNLTSAQFTSFVNASIQISDSQANIAYGAIVPIAEKKAFESKSTEVTEIPFIIKRVSGDFDSPDTQYLFPIVQIWSKANQNIDRFVTVDMGGVPMLKSGLKLLMETRRPVALPIMKGIAGLEFDEPFFLFLTPVFDDQGDLVTGFVSQTIYVSAALDDILFDLKSMNLGVSISNIGMRQNANVIDFNSNELDEPLIDTTVFEFRISIAQKKWTVTIRPLGKSYLPDKTAIAMVAIICILLTILAVFLVWHQGRRAITISALVNKRTEALREAHSELEDHYVTLQKLNMELDDARKSAEKSSTEKSDFLATMSHELRTPLNAILGFSQIIKEEALGAIEEQKYVEYATDINDSGIHLLSLINNVLDLAKLEAGKVLLDTTVVSVAAVIDGALRMVRQAAIDKGIELRLNLPEDLPEYIMGDEMRLKQILINLLSNSVKFTSQGYVELSIYRETLSDNTPGWVITITDTGIGIAKDQQGDLFERFTQVEGAKNRKFGGTGLGLAICWELVNRMGGGIVIESNIGEGAKFIITLPLTDAAAGDDDDVNDMMI